VPVVRYAAVLRWRLRESASITAVGAIAFAIRPGRSGLALPALVGAVLVLQLAWRTRVLLRRIRYATPFWTNMTVRVEDVSTQPAGAWPLLALLAVVAWLGGLGEAGALAIAVSLPYVLGSLIEQAAVRCRERRGVELFSWSDFEDSQPVPQISAHLRGTPLPEA